MDRGARAVCLASAVLFFSGLGRAQEKPDAAKLPDTPVPKQSGNHTAKESGKNGLQSTVGLVARRSFFYPELATSPEPLTAEEKFKLFLSESVSPPQILSAAAVAGISQARDTLSEYGQGGEGYAKRFGAAMADGSSSHFFGTFVLPSLLHQDPRYFPKLEGSFGHRIGYALSRVVITREDAGGETFNWSSTLGPLAAETLANTYLPASEQNPGRTIRRYGIRVGFGAVNNVLKEYWPDIFKKLRMGKVAPGLKPEPAPA